MGSSRARCLGESGRRRARFGQEQEGSEATTGSQLKALTPPVLPRPQLCRVTIDDGWEEAFGVVGRCNCGDPILNSAVSERKRLV